MPKRNIALIILFILIIFAVGFIYTNFFQKRVSQIPEMKKEEIQKTPKTTLEETPRLSIVAKNLEIPWALVFLPDKSILFTERPGRVRFIDASGNLNPSPIATLPDVKQIGEGGLLGIAINPDFLNKKFVYLYYTYSGNENQTLNRVVRFKFENNTLSDQTIIVDKIPGAPNHNGGRIKFGPDGFLYITTGDAQNPSLAQNQDSLAGKILRVTDNGKPANDNPLNDPEADGGRKEIYSWGHRNPQGITWDEKGQLWETEHGSSAFDELNFIVMSDNYGWPSARGNDRGDGLVPPILHSGQDTWAPSGAAYLNGSVFFGGLRGQALFEYDIENKKLTPHFKGELGRIREVVVGPDNMLYITTSNRDGRGVPDAEDDKIIRVNPNKL